MPHRTLRAVGIALVTCALVATGSVASEQAAKQAEAIVRHAGLDHQLDRLAKQLVQLVLRQARDLPPEDSERLDLALRENLTGDALREAMLTAIAARYKARHADVTLAWLRSPLGIRITALDTLTATPEGRAGIREYAKTLAQSPPEEGPLERARRFAAATGEAELELELMTAATFTATQVFEAALPPERRTDPAELRQRLEVRKSASGPVVAQMMLASFLYRYRDLSNDELTRYLQFVESDAGRWFHRIIGKAVLEAVAATTARTVAAVSIQPRP